MPGFLLFIREQSVTQKSMGREAPRYPPQYPRSIKKSNFHDEISRHWYLERVEHNTYTFDTEC